MISTCSHKFPPAPGIVLLASVGTNPTQYAPLATLMMALGTACPWAALAQVVLVAHRGAISTCGTLMAESIPSRASPVVNSVSLSNQMAQRRKPTPCVRNRQMMALFKRGSGTQLVQPETTTPSIPAVGSFTKGYFKPS